MTEESSVTEARSGEGRGLDAGTPDIPSLPDLAYQRLRDAVLSGAFSPGQALRQEDLASRIGTSRGPVREALNRLEVEGLVLQRPRRGYVVASLDPDEIEDIFDIRIMLEQRAGYLAAKRRTDADVAAVAALLRALEEHRITTFDDVMRFAELNREFHGRLFEASGRPHLCRMMAMLRANVERFIRVDTSLAGKFVQSDHYQIFDAFRRGDAAATGRLCRMHCERVRERLISCLKDERQRLQDQ